MKKGFTKGAWSKTIKRVAISTLALATLFMFNATAVSASEAEVAAREQVRLGGRISTEREERVRLVNFREIRNELSLERPGNRERTEREERVRLVNFREIRDELGFERSGNRQRTEM